MGAKVRSLSSTWRRPIPFFSSMSSMELGLGIVERPAAADTRDAEFGAARTAARHGKRAAADFAPLNQQAVVLAHPAFRAQRIIGVNRQIAVQQPAIAAMNWSFSMGQPVMRRSTFTTSCSARAGRESYALPVSP